MELTALRESARRCAAAAAAALVFALGVAACTGDEEHPDPAPSTKSTPADDGTGSASDGGGAEITDSDLTAATDRFLDFLWIVDDRDWESACGYVLDPETGAAPEGERRQQCTDGARSAMADYEEMLKPGVFDQLDASMVQAEPADDGAIALCLLEQPVEIPMIRGDDGRWYLSIPF
jgi:hypothetical protein